MICGSPEVKRARIGQSGNYMLEDYLPEFQEGYMEPAYGLDELLEILKNLQKEGHGNLNIPKAIVTLAIGVKHLSLQMKHVKKKIAQEK